VGSARVAPAPRDVERVRQACVFIREHADAPPTLSGLAALAGVSRFHFQRTFRAVVGVTPKQFAESCRLARLKGGLRRQATVTDAIYDAGYGSGSRVYERAGSHLGMTPGQYRDGGRQVEITYATVASPLGRLMIAATDRGLCFVQFADSDHALLRMLREEYPSARLERMRQPAPPQFATWMAALRDQLRGKAPRAELPVDLRATAFQLKVWSYLRTIPAGQVATYGEVAAGIGRPTAARAVARACAANRVALAIPCHRVIRGGGDLGGYRWGVHRKRALLDREHGGARPRATGTASAARGVAPTGSPR
jgi:AraC family transcriptional regulator of adaptative response/methylated-DNA-[protein]-cysteine methyltransferase